MEIDYRAALLQALATTRRLDLASADPDPIFMSQAVDKRGVLGMLGDFITHLYSQGLERSSALNGNCVMVHDQLQSYLAFHDVPSHMTIGSMCGDGWKYFDTSLADLERELAQPNGAEEIRVHTWLTLDDGSLLDWTGQAWLDVMTGAEHKAEDCLIFMHQDEHATDRYYSPLLIGNEFLMRTNCIDRRPIS